VTGPSIELQPPNANRPSTDVAVALPVGKEFDVERWKVGIASWGVGVAYLAAHLISLAPSLEDIDSINFALGLRDYNPAEHQPHPPGYPVYIGLGRFVLALVTAV